MYKLPWFSLVPQTHLCHSQRLPDANFANVLNLFYNMLVQQRRLISRINKYPTYKIYFANRVNLTIIILFFKNI